MYPFAHLLADSSSKSFLTASDASLSNADTVLDDAFSFPVKTTFAHPISGETVQSSVGFVMVSVGDGCDGEVRNMRSVEGFKFKMSTLTFDG